MKKKEILFCLTIFFFLLTSFLSFRAGAVLPCQCLEDRVLELKNPPMSGEDVFLLQQRLKELDFSAVNLDGIYGVETAEKIAVFQAKNQMEPTGIVDVMTWDALGEGVFPVNKIKAAEVPEGELSIIVNTYKRTLTLCADGKAVKTYPVAVGKPSTKSPVGEWAIIHKSKDWGGGFGTRWLGFNVPWGIYGIHGTNKPWAIGGAVSHGCIRMHNQHVEELYEWVPLKTRVKIIGKRLPIAVNRVLEPGQNGLSVMQLQDNLQQVGIDSGYLDGRYGKTTELAVKEIEAQYSLQTDGIADWNVLYLLQLPDRD